MYKIVYAKTALKDIPKLKSAHLDEKAKDSARRVFKEVRASIFAGAPLPAQRK